MNINLIGQAEWVDYARDAHLICFNEIIHPMQQRIDYALLASHEDTSEPMAYMTCREMDNDSVYWQYGGAFPEAKNTINSFKAYKSFLEWHEKRYKYISTLIHNCNLPMLKMAMKIGYRITGTRTYKNNVFLEHTIDYEEINKKQQGDL